MTASIARASQPSPRSHVVLVSACRRPRRRAVLGGSRDHRDPARPLASDADLRGIDAYRVNGTPADCVALGIFHWEDVDVVLSGVNLGSNLGNATWHSGTLAAAKQATLLGIRGIALSAPASDEEPDFEPLSLDRQGARDALSTSAAPDSSTSTSPETRRHSLDRPSSRPYDGKVVPGQRPDGPRALLVHRRALERHRREPISGRSDTARLDHAAAARPHRPPGAGASANTERSRRRSVQQP